jgi:hypothetical protein
MAFDRDDPAPISATLLMKIIRGFKTILILERNKLNMRRFIAISFRVGLKSDGVGFKCSLWGGGGGLSGG